MPDPYLRLASGAPGRAILRRLSLPVPVPLRRHRPDEPLTTGPVLLLGAADDDLGAIMRSFGVDVHTDTPPDGYGAIVLDARGLRASGELALVPQLLSPVVRSLRPHGRVLVVARPPDTAGTTGAAVAQRALEGVTRSLGKELRDGATCNLLQIETGAEAGAESALRFLLSARSAYVSGQVVRVEATPPHTPLDWHRPLDSAVALVTGAANGIGASIARVLSRDGAHVVCVDTPAQNDALRAVASSVGGHPLSLDLTDAHAADRIAAQLRQAHDGVDVVVHNAGITRDRTLARMEAEQWSSVLDVNLTATERLTDALLADGLLRVGGAIVATSSINGIAGNRGQTNYAASKAGIIGLVDTLAASLRGSGRRINAVAPGFIETRLTARMPALTREVARRLNSLGQGGQPVDVAETVAWLAAPATAGVNGQTIRVCGQALLGA